jgi:hypothetical protein
MSVAIVGAYVAATWSTDKTFPWALLVGFPSAGVFSGLIVAAAKWHLSESSFRKMASSRH